MTQPQPAGFAPPPYACPQCRRPVRADGDGYRCGVCLRSFPVVAGIPDFRLQPDPWIGIEEDRAKALRLLEVTGGLSFADSVQAYWALTPETPQEQAHRFIRHVDRAGARSREWLATVHRLPSDGRVPWIDLGCGTADLIAAAGERGLPTLGVDIALRWLVVARKRPGVPDRPGTLVCCGAEHLPFPDGAFGGAFALGLLEHCRDPGAVLAEARRVLRPDAAVLIRGVNRYSVLSEPHVGVWGVGYVPRRYADAYVRWRRRRRYVHHRPLSSRELGRALRSAGFAQVVVRAARALPSEIGQLSPLGRRVAQVYEIARSVPGVRAALRWTAPLLEAAGTAA